jgi:mRNA-degrading endonuclease toxin of MazEF toxin-antitoxin module
VARRVRQGDVVRIDLTTSAVGREAGAAHPLVAIVVQADRYRFGATIVVVPLTTNLSFDPPYGVPVAADPESGLRAPSMALCHQPMAIDAGRRIVDRPSGRVPQATLDRIARNVAILLGGS